MPCSPASNFPPGETAPAHVATRPFDFNRDRFAFVNELKWTYHRDAASGQTSFTRRKPKPGYTLHCFVMARAVRQFFFHAQFDQTLPVADEPTYRRSIREVVRRNSRVPCPPDHRVIFPGYHGLHEFSSAWEPLLKDECGGAWRSYVLRSHWRMVLPISRGHQAATAERLSSRLQAGFPPIVHLVRFPQLTINHGMMVFEVDETGDGPVFNAYDPNDPTQFARLAYDPELQTFTMPANTYWRGGRVDVIEIYRNWFF